MKSKKFRSAFLAILLSFAATTVFSPAYSAKWDRLTGGDEWVVNIDTESLFVEKNKRAIWVLWNYSKPQTESSDGLYQSSKARWHFDCKLHLAGLKSIVAYSESHGLGTLVWQKSVEQPVLEEIVPDSVGETLWKRVCLLKK